MKISIITSFLIILLHVCFVNSKAQTIDFNNAPIAEIIQKIEENTSYRFNYNPNSVRQISYTGKLSLNKMQATLQAIQLQTPLQFEQQDSTIIVILPEPKLRNICGYLFCKLDKTPLAFANLYFKFSKTGLATDKQGYFKTDIKCYEDEPIQLSYVGYQNKEVFITLFENTDCPTVQLSPKENMLNIGLVVKDYILPSVEEGKTHSSVSLNYKRMVEEENFLDSDVLQNIQILPGIVSFDESATNISIRGNESGHCITRWENVQLYNIGHFFGMLSAINPYIINDVQVYKSSFHPNLGNTIGGVVDISLSDKISEKFDGGVGLDMTKVFSYFNVPLVKNKLSLSLSTQNSFGESLDSPTLKQYANKVFQNILSDDMQMKEKFEERNEPEIQFYDVQAKLNYKPNKKWSVNTSFFKAFDSYEYSSILNREKIELDDLITTNTTAINTEATFNPIEKNRFKGYFNYSNYINAIEFSSKNEDEDDPHYEEEFTNEIESTEVGLSYQLKHHKHWVSDFSINTENKELSYNIKERTSFEREDIDEKDREFAFFVHQDLHTTFSNKKWTVDIGLRNTWYADINGLFFSPRANVQYKISKTLKLKAAAGWYNQFISQLTKFDRENIDNNPIWYLNAYQRDEVLYAKKLSVGSIFKQSQWLIDVEAYLQQTQNLPGLSTLINSENPIDYFGTGFTRGIDVMAHKKWKTLALWANYALSKNEYTFTDISSKPFPASNDNRHNVSFNSSYTYKNWQWAVNYHFRTALPYSSRPSIEKNINNEDVILTYKNINDLRLPGFYSRLDAAVSYHRPLFNNTIQFNGRLSIINLLNKTNYESIDYRLIENRIDRKPKLIEIENYLLGITPQLTFHFSW